MPRVSKRPHMPKPPSIPMPPVGGPSGPAGLGDPSQAAPGLGGPMPPNPISQGKIQIGGFNPKKGGMF